LARGLVEARLAACVNILPGLTSVYTWQGAIQTAQETLLLIKTEREAYARLEAWLQQRHPYELPEIIAVSIDEALPAYLHWISQCLTPAV
jgi:periplasmic divalent cation tolerance protein